MRFQVAGLNYRVKVRFIDRCAHCSAALTRCVPCPCSLRPRSTVVMTWCFVHSSRWAVETSRFSLFARESLCQRDRRVEGVFGLLRTCEWQLCTVSSVSFDMGALAVLWPRLSMQTITPTFCVFVPPIGFCCHWFLRAYTQACSFREGPAAVSTASVTVREIQFETDDGGHFWHGRVVRIPAR